MKFTVQHYGCYPGRVLFLLGPFDMERMKTLARKLEMWNGEGDFSPPDDNVPGCCWDLGINQIIWLERYHFSDPSEVGMLAHEAVHAAVNHADALGFKHSQDSVEHYCYIVEFIVGAFVNAVKEKTMKEVR